MTCAATVSAAGLPAGPAQFRIGVSNSGSPVILGGAPTARTSLLAGGPHSGTSPSATSGSSALTWGATVVLGKKPQASRHRKCLRVPRVDVSSAPHAMPRTYAGVADRSAPGFAFVVYRPDEEHAPIRNSLGRRDSPGAGCRRGAKEAGTGPRREALLREVGVAGSPQASQARADPMPRSDRPTGRRPASPEGWSGERSMAGGVPKKRRTSGQAGGILGGRLRRSDRDLLAHRVRRAGRPKAPGLVRGLAEDVPPRVSPPRCRAQ